MASDPGGVQGGEVLGFTTVIDVFDHEPNKQEKFEVRSPSHENNKKSKLKFEAKEEFGILHVSKNISTMSETEIPSVAGSRLSTKRLFCLIF